jgi:hypothetical protein
VCGKFEIQKNAKINISVNMLQAHLRHKNIFAGCNDGAVDSNPALGMDVCLFNYAFVMPCIGSGLATGWSTVQGALSTAYKIQISKSINFEYTQA